MYCRNCGQQIEDNAATCIHCGFATNTGSNYCSHCGTKTAEGQAVCTACGFSLSKSKSFSANGSFMRAKEGKLIGGVFSGMEKYKGINRWIGRLISIILPLWPIWLIAYVIICVSVPMDEQ